MRTIYHLHTKPPSASQEAGSVIGGCWGMLAAAVVAVAYRRRGAKDQELQSSMPRILTAPLSTHMAFSVLFFLSHSRAHVFNA